MSDHDAVIQARNAVARACGALDVIAGNAEITRHADALRQIITELEATGAWLRSLHGMPSLDPGTITVARNTGDAPDIPASWRWHATRTLPDGTTRTAYGPTPEAAVAQLCGRVVASVDPDMTGVGS